MTTNLRSEVARCSRELAEATTKATEAKRAYDEAMARMRRADVALIEATRKMKQGTA